MKICVIRGQQKHTAPIYGDSKELPKVEASIGEALSPYAVTKQVNEKYAHVFHLNYGLEVIGQGYFNVFGKRQSPAGEYATVIPKFVELFMQHKSPTINGDGSFSRDFTYIDNVIQMNNLAATIDNAAAIGQVFNTAVGETSTLIELLTSLKITLGEFDSEIMSVKTVFGEPRLGDIPHSLANIDKAKELLNFIPKYDIKRGLQETLVWYWSNFQKR